jgi:hypothetical protein
MNKVRASLTLVVLLCAGFANFVGCTPDEPPPDTTSSTGSGSSSGVPTTCGDGKLDMGETCDDGNNSGNDGCTSCAVDECYSCSDGAGDLSTCTFAASATACQMTKVCDGAGKCVECVEDAQCAGGYCHENKCAKCDDTIKNGDESDADCGGTHCGKCMDGKTCGLGDDCTSAFCVDGVCCADACDGACQACNLAGSEGTCDLVAQYGEDTSYTENGAAASCLAADNKACNGGGICGKAVGQTCTSPAQCASTKCVDNDGDMVKNCVKAAGEACTMNIECQSNMCDTATMMCM